MGKIPDRALFLFAGLVYLFLYAPILVLMFFSFNSTRSTQVWTGFSTEWYGELHQGRVGPRRLQALDDRRRDGHAIATVIGTLTALALTRHELPGQDRSPTRRSTRRP